MAKKYTFIYDVLNDAEGYAIVREGGDLSLGNLQPLAVVRWPWVVQNWQSIYQNFEAVAKGDDVLTTQLTELDKVVTSYKLGNTKYNPFASFNDFVKYSDILKLIPLSSLLLTTEEVAVRDNEIQRLNELRIEDFRSAILFLRQQEAILYNEIGLGDEDANLLYGISNVQYKRAASLNDIKTISQLAEMVKILEGYIIDLQTTQARPPNLLEAANKNLDANSDILIDNSFLTYYTVPFEISLESMAQKYLGSVDRWYELATVNKLRPPYIDEIGTKFSLLAPGALNSIIVSSQYIENIAVGTKLGIGSFRYKEETRVVERVTVNENNTAIIFLSGAQDINKFKPNEGAFVRVYKPGTTRKGQLLFIPSRIPTISKANSTPQNDTLRRLEKAFLDFGIDIYRDEKTQDVVFDANGNYKYSYGFHAVKQAVLNCIRTRVGELPFHPNYGINANIGEQFFGTTDEALIFGQIIRNAIMVDSRFEDIVIANLTVSPNSMSLKLLVKIKGFGSYLPLAFVA